MEGKEAVTDVSEGLFAWHRAARRAQREEDCMLSGFVPSVSELLIARRSFRSRSYTSIDGHSPNIFSWGHAVSGTGKEWGRERRGSRRERSFIDERPTSIKDLAVSLGTAVTEGQWRRRLRLGSCLEQTSSASSKSDEWPGFSWCTLTVTVSSSEALGRNPSSFIAKLEKSEDKLACVVTSGSRPKSTVSYSEGKSMVDVGESMIPYGAVPAELFRLGLNRLWRKVDFDGEAGVPVSWREAVDVGLLAGVPG